MKLRMVILVILCVAVSTAHAQAPVSVILPTEASGQYDSRSVFAPFVMERNGMFYMYYTSYAGGNTAGAINISLATSVDGRTWTKSDANPLLTQPELVQHAAFPSVFVDQAGTWVMLFNVVSINNGYPGGTLRRATSAAADGPWVIDAEPVVRTDLKRWDAKILAATVLWVEGAYRLYYTGFDQRFGNPQLGLATSADGLTWTFHDDPATTDDLTKGSDPIFSGEGLPITAGNVVMTEAGYGLYFLNLDRDFHEASRPTADLMTMGYATSADGLIWTAEAWRLELPQRAWVDLFVQPMETGLFVYFDEWETHGIGLMVH